MRAKKNLLGLGSATVVSHDFRKDESLGELFAGNMTAFETKTEGEGTKRSNVTKKEGEDGCALLEELHIGLRRVHVDAGNARVQHGGLI